MPIETLLKEVNIKQLTTLEPEPENVFPWTEVPKKVWDQAEKDIKDENLHIEEKIGLAANMKLLHPSWNIPEDIADEIYNHLYINIMSESSRIKPFITFDAWVLAPNISRRALMLPSAKDACDSIIRELEFVFNNPNNSDISNEICRLLDLKDAVPDLNIPQYMLDGIKERVISFRDFRYQQMMEYGGSSIVSNFFDHARAYKVFYPNEPEYKIPNSG